MTPRTTPHWKNGPPRCVLITGGGSGIGRELAGRLAAEGAQVGIINRRSAPSVVDEMKRVAKRPDQRFASYAADVTNATALAETVTRAVNDLGRPDLVINSAGIQNAKPFAEQSVAEFEDVVRVNLFGSRNFAAAMAPHLESGAHMVFIGSLAGLAGNFAYTAYCASKFGVRGLAECLRLELRLRGVEVSLCCPAEVLTPLVAEERKTLHPISAALKDFAGTQPVEVSCDRLLRGIARREFEITDGFRPGLTAFLVRHFPGLMQRTSDGITAKVVRQSASDGRAG